MGQTAPDPGERNRCLAVLEAYALALRRQLNVVVLVTGHADFLQLIRKLNAIGTRTMLTGWDLPIIRQRIPDTYRTGSARRGYVSGHDERAH